MKQTSTGAAEHLFNYYQTTFTLSFNSWLVRHILMRINRWLTFTGTLAYSLHLTITMKRAKRHGSKFSPRRVGLPSLVHGRSEIRSKEGSAIVDGQALVENGIQIELILPTKWKQPRAGEGSVLDAGRPTHAALNHNLHSFKLIPHFSFVPSFLPLE